MKKYLSQMGMFGRTALATGIAILALAGIAQASTTISTNISTAGTITVTGTGVSSLGQATTTLLSANYAQFGATATTTISTAGLITTPGLTVGLTNGTAMTQILKGTCNLILVNTTITASTTRAADCAVTGVVANDLVLAQFATTTIAAGTGSGWLITGASASSTSGYITLSIVNNTGANATIPASIASTTQYLIIR